MNPESPSPVAPERPTDYELVQTTRELAALVQRGELARLELIAAVAKCEDRGINPDTWEPPPLPQPPAEPQSIPMPDPATYTVGAGDSTTIEHKEP